MPTILKWSIPVVVVGAAVWLVLSLGIRMPIDKQARIATPAGPIEFRVLVFPDSPVRIQTAHDFHDVVLPRREIDRIYSEGRKSDRLQVPLPGGADVSIRRSADGSWDGFWTMPPGTPAAPYLPVRFFDFEPGETSNDPAAVPGYGGRWRVQATDGASALLELHAFRDASGLLGVCSTFTGHLELIGHADADGLRLTYFDGERAIAVRGRINDYGTLAGDWWDSRRGLLTWTAERED